MLSVTGQNNKWTQYNYVIKPFEYYVLWVYIYVEIWDTQSE